jgi:hypothetical protein
MKNARLTIDRRYLRSESSQQPARPHAVGSLLKFRDLNSSASVMTANVAVREL